MIGFGLPRRIPTILVRENLRDVDSNLVILDPFSGTGTTGLVAAEYGMKAKLLDINPFLVWLGRTKCRNYSLDEIRATRCQAIKCIENARFRGEGYASAPPIHRIERWWDDEVLDRLGCLKSSISDSCSGLPGDDLLLVAFCRVMIAVSNVSFNHQSMSFRKDSALQSSMFSREGAADEVFDRFLDEVDRILASVSDDLSGKVDICVDDARLMKSISSDSIDMIHTSPPYANRMSYIRELRPYMYWLGYLTSGRQAGELDWRSIGGTWGIATSRLSGWDCSLELPIGKEFRTVIGKIAESDNPNATLLSNYVHKYFYDMVAHFEEAYRVMRSGGRVAYVVGNSTFYGNVTPSERWYAKLMSAAGFEDITTRVIRKRNSNKKLFEYIVEAVRP